MRCEIGRSLRRGRSALALLGERERDLVAQVHGLGRCRIDAQAAGDFAAIESHDLPILRVHLGDDVDAGLAALERALTAALDQTSEG